MVSLTCAEPVNTRETVAGETPASAATFAMVMFLAVVVSFDDLHDAVQVGQALAEWFHALQASARDPYRRAIAAGTMNTFQDFSRSGATFCRFHPTVTVEDSWASSGVLRNKP
ncbi:hypothetical protein Kisp02_56720 [Kineosporia sp. NBRC 101731]|nr:hypothetical protein Kisp02_56720 [Kineosporia sp. NBRC 101731]